MKLFIWILVIISLFILFNIFTIIKYPVEITLSEIPAKIIKW